jgi:hypothetical protein
MTVHRNEDAVSEQRLNEAERRQLADWWLYTNDDTLGSFRRSLVPVVEAILTARLAKVEALADDWERRGGMKSRAWRVLGPQSLSVPFVVASLRAALSGDPEGSAMHTARIIDSLPDCEGWACQSCGADNFIPPGFARVTSPGSTHPDPEGSARCAHCGQERDQHSVPDGHCVKAGYYGNRFEASR